MRRSLLRIGLIAVTRFLVGGHPRWVGSAPGRGQRIYFANHGSHLDTIILWAALPEDLRAATHPVAAADYWGKTALRRYVALKVLNCVLIDRRRAASGSDPLEPLAAKLRDGASLIIFPEGTRGAERLPGPFKSGLYSLGRAFPGAELVPVYLDNLSRAYPKGAYLPAPILCGVRFGEALRIGTAENRADFLHRAREAVVALAGPSA